MVLRDPWHHCLGPVSIFFWRKFDLVSFPFFLSSSLPSLFFLSFHFHHFFFSTPRSQPRSVHRSIHRSVSISIFDQGAQGEHKIKRPARNFAHRYIEGYWCTRYVDTRSKQLERYSSQEDAGSRLASNATGYLKATNIEHDNDNDTWDSKRVTIPFRCFGNSSSISSAFRFFFLFENKTLKQLNQDSTSSNVEENKIGLSHRDRHVLIVEVQQSRQSCQINLYSGKASAERGREECSLHFLATVLISASRAWQAITDSRRDPLAGRLVQNFRGIPAG